MQRAEAISPWDGLVFAGLAVSFAISHGTSFRQNVEADLRGRPNLGALLFLPYLRILPMHFTILFGTSLGHDSAFALTLFAALKTFADVTMHSVEHRWLQRAAAPASSSTAGEGT